tara:strand:+ start:336 stop:572 length:237 start_codon:yes stop_codon:yes gene_type:complete
MGYWWSERAADLQYQVRTEEYEMNMDYEEDHVRRSTVHAREDIVLLVSQLSSANQQLRTISRFYFCILLVLIVIGVNI